LAVAELGVASSTTALATEALRSRLEAVVIEAALAGHYERHPEARPSLAEQAIAAAEIDGHPLTVEPDRLRKAAAEIVVHHPDADADDVLLVGRGTVVERGVRRLVLLDNEAVQALMATGHPKQRRVLAHVAVVGARKKKAANIDLMVRPQCGSKRAGNRSSPGAPSSICLASAMPRSTPEHPTRRRTGVRPRRFDRRRPHRCGGPPRPESDSVTILTSDPKDIGTVSGPRTVTIVRL